MSILRKVIGSIGEHTFDFCKAISRTLREDSGDGGRAHMTLQSSCWTANRQIKYWLMPEEFDILYDHFL